MRVYFFSLLFITVSTHGQVIEKTKSALTNIRTHEQAKTYLSSDPSIVGQLFELHSPTDTLEFDKELLALPPGEIIEFELDDQKTHYFYKSISTVSFTSFRVQYIFLDNRKLSLQQIDSLRTIIMERLKKGDSFGQLAQVYSMDNNAKKGGDLGWFKEGMINSEFEDKVRCHQVGEIYSVDIPSEKWYYIVKNSHLPKPGRKALVLYIEVKSRDSNAREVISARSQGYLYTVI